MKKILLMLLSCLLILSMAACGNDSDSNKDKKDKDSKDKQEISMDLDIDADDLDIDDFNGGNAVTVTPGSSSDIEKIKNFIEENEDELLGAMEESFATSSGMTCTSSIKVEGNGFIIKININELDNIDAETKQAMKDAYDSMDSTFDALLDNMKTELPELEYFEIDVCEKDGDLLAPIVVGDK